MSNPIQIDILALQQDIESGMKRPEVLSKYGLKNNWLNRIIKEHHETTGVLIKFRRFKNKPYEIVNSFADLEPRENLNGNWSVRPHYINAPVHFEAAENDLVITNDNSSYVTPNDPITTGYVSVGDSPGTIVSPITISSGSVTVNRPLTQDEMERLNRGESVVINEVSGSTTIYNPPLRTGELSSTFVLGSGPFDPFETHSYTVTGISGDVVFAERANVTRNQDTSTETPVDQAEGSVNNTPPDQVEMQEIEW